MLPPVLWTYIGRQFSQQKGRVFLTVLGLALGIAITLAIQLTNHTAVRQFKQSVEVVAGQASMGIFPTTTRFIDQHVLFQLAPIWEAGGQFTPVLEFPAIIPLNATHFKKENPAVSIDGTEEPLDKALSIRVLGVDMMVDARFRPLEFETPPDEVSRIFKPALISPSSSPKSLNQQLPTVYLPERLATELGVKLNQPLSVWIGVERKNVLPIGILKNQGVGRSFGGDVLLMDIGQAQLLSGQLGKISRIDIQSPPVSESAAKTPEQFEQFVESLLPSYVQLNTIRDQTAQGQKLLSAFQTNLTALSFIGLLVGMFLMYNTMSVAILRRQKEIGLLRTLALTQSQIAKLFFVELIIYGVLGSGLGCLLGVGMAQITTSLVSQTVEMLYTGLPLHQVSFSWGWLAVIFLLGVITTVIAGCFPLWQSTRIEPAVASRPAVKELSSQYAWCGWLAGLFWLVALWASQQPAINGLPIWGHVCSFTFILGGAFFVPLTLPLLFKGFKRLFPSVSIRIAASQLLLHRGRTSVAIASLMMAIAMVVSIGVMIHSFRETVTLWVNQSITADLWIEPVGPNQVTKRLIPPSIPKRIETLPHVKAVDPFLEQPIQYQGQATRLAVGDFKVFEALGNLQFLSGQAASQVMKSAIESQGVVVTEPFANQFHVQVGDSILLPTPGGDQAFPVKGVYRDYSSEQGFIVMNRETYQQFFSSGDDLTGIAVYIDPSVTASQIRRDILALLPEEVSLSVQTQAGLKQEIFTIFDQTFAITHALHLISVIVAILAIVNTLISLSLELKREFNVLRMIGFSQHKVKEIQWVQALWMGGLSSILALPVGVVLSMFLVFVINVQAFHWTIDYHCPPLFLLETVIAVVLVSALAGWATSRFLVKLSPEKEG